MPRNGPDETSGGCVSANSSEGEGRHRAATTVSMLHRAELSQFGRGGGTTSHSHHCLNAS
eukprot:9703896-Alexandrium_andersonii.AAC.1